VNDRGRTWIWDRRLVMAVAALAAAILTTGQAPASTKAVVDIEHFKFGPPQLTVPVGATVTWTNHDEETHTVTSTAGAFASTGLGNDETFTQTFTRPGTYEYFCALHPKMRATVIVK
jgi:plastocyanin